MRPVDPLRRGTHIRRARYPALLQRLSGALPGIGPGGVA